MNRKITILSVSYTLFLVLSVTAEFLPSPFSFLLSTLSLILPIFLALFLSGGDNGSELFCISNKDLSLSLPLFAPTILLTIIISYLTSLLIFEITGKTNSVSVGDSFFTAILIHALMPAVLEELLFRYLPLKLIAPHSKRAAIILSAIFFSLAHRNIFVIPYALFAGASFMVIDVAFGSIIPSILIHFANNAISVGTIVYNDNPYFAPTIYALLIVIAIASAVSLFIKRKDYKDRFLCALDSGEGVKFTAAVVIFILSALGISIVNFI